MGDLKILNEENKKWFSSKGSRRSVKKWAIKDKSGDWWLVSGSEFPEKNVKKEDVKKDEGVDFVLIMLSSILIASIAFNILIILKVVL